MAQRQPVDPETLRQLAAQLGGTPSGLDPRLAEALKKFPQGQNLDPRLLDQLKNWVEKDPKAAQNWLGKQGFDQTKTQQLMQEIKVDPNLPKKFDPIKPPPKDPKVDPPPPPVTPTTPITNPQQGGIQPPEFPRPNSNPQQNQEFQSAVQFWEQNIGPIDQTPAVRDALIEMFTNTKLDGSGGGDSIWKDLLKDVNTPGNNSKSSGLFKWLDRQTTGSSWKLPSWGGSVGSGSSSGWNAPRPSGFNAPSISGSGFAIAGLGTAGSLILFAMLAAVVAFLLWRYWPAVVGRERQPTPLPGLGPWPIDPRAIATREELVTAFEYLSLLECGPAAQVWNHVTIADALRLHLPAAEEIADPLARLYALARYTPMQEPFTERELIEARGYLCQLAGVRPV
jgi:hypothetical protein